MAIMDTVENGPALEVDWMQCELIEQVPGKVSGRPIVLVTRILPGPIVNSYDLAIVSRRYAKAFRRFQ